MSPQRAFWSGSSPFASAPSVPTPCTSRTWLGTWVACLPEHLRKCITAHHASKTSPLEMFMGFFRNCKEWINLESIGVWTVLTAGLLCRRGRWSWQRRGLSTLTGDSQMPRTHTQSGSSPFASAPSVPTSCISTTWLGTWVVLCPNADENVSNPPGFFRRSYIYTISTYNFQHIIIPIYLICVKFRYIMHITYAFHFWYIW